MEKKEKKEEKVLIKGDERKIRNVIVGIDFSECSLSAMQNAIFIAEKFGAKLTLLFVVSPDTKILVGAVGIDKTGTYSLIEMKLKSLVADCKKVIPKNIVTYKIRQGKTSKEINREAKEQKDALIVVGTHGCSGFKEVFIGSSAFRTISGSSCPVLTVRNGVNVAQHLSEILIVIDDTMETLQKLKLTANIANKFYARVHIVGLKHPQYPNTFKVIEKYVKQVENYLVRQNIRIVSTFVKNEGKVETVLKYASENNINLIVIMKEVDLAGDVFVLAPFGERIVNRSPVPVLTVNVDPIIYPQ
ncbi:MAG: universal stress protein [Bacteroidales bacterium]|jgi:nucleotide-binding universal stress UspA family protein|nr:universal stress protein [Bacteroidales bacterium]